MQPRAAGRAGQPGFAREGGDAGVSWLRLMGTQSRGDREATRAGEAKRHLKRLPGFPIMSSPRSIKGVTP